MVRNWRSNSKASSSWGSSTPKCALGEGAAAVVRVVRVVLVLPEVLLVLATRLVPPTPEVRAAVVQALAVAPPNRARLGRLSP